MIQGLIKLISLSVVTLLASCAIQPIKNHEQKLPASVELREDVQNHEGLNLEAEESTLIVELEGVETQVEKDAIDVEIASIEIDEVENTIDEEDEPELEQTPFLTYDENSKRVKAWVNYFTKDNKARFQRFINNGTPFKRDIQKVFHANNLPIDLYYVGLIESGYNLKARSHASAVGPWQFVRSAAKDYGLKRTSLMDERYDLHKSTNAAATYFKDLYNIFGSWELALSAYNAGPSRIIYMIRKGNTRDFATLSKSRRFPKETANYIPKVVAVMKILKNPERYGFKIPNTTSRFSHTKKIRLRYSVPLNTISRKLNIPLKKLKRLNPELISNRTPFLKRSPYYLRIPANTYRAKAKQVASLYNYRGTRPYAGNSSSVASNHTHRVRKGENLSLIAKKYRLSLRTLKRLNNLKRSHIFAGQKLKVRKPSSRSRRRSVVSSNSKTHKVRRGENLSLIAKKYGMNIRSIKRANNLRSSKIRVGQRLKINRSSKNVYVVRRGDNLNRIARKFGKSMKRLMASNDLKSSKIFPGQELRIH